MQNNKNLYPNQLIQRPTHVPPLARDLRIGDRVTLHPANATTPIETTVTVVVPMDGFTTYTSERVLSPAQNGRRAQVARYRFRHQDVHHVA